MPDEGSLLSLNVHSSGRSCRKCPFTFKQHHKNSFSPRKIRGSFSNHRSADKVGDPGTEQPGVGGLGWGPIFITQVILVII